MAFKDTLTNTRLYTEADPYIWTVDNRPLSDLDARDDQLADRIDAINIGRIDVTGAASPTTNSLPTGWSITRNGAGDYTITHNKNTTAYSVIGTCLHATQLYVVVVYALTANTFSIKTAALTTGTLTDVRFMLQFTTAA